VQNNLRLQLGSYDAGAAASRLFVRRFRRERGDDLFEARIAAHLSPQAEGQDRADQLNLEMLQKF
jgi:hypothetical protein